MLKKVGLIVILTALSGAASAGESCTWFLGLIPICKPTTTGPTVAPEIDLGSTAAGLTLALGGLLVVRARRARSAK